jgi:predicted small lipoprotein YifL
MKYYATILLIGFFLTGCGQKGDLFLIEPEATVIKQKPVVKENENL